MDNEKEITGEWPQDQNTLPAPPPAAQAKPSPSLVVLTNKETAEKYECTFTRNDRVHVPGVWSGLISDVPPNVAAILIKQGHNAVRLKGQ